MRPLLFPVLIALALAPLSGCVGGDDGGGDKSPPPVENLATGVTVTSAPAKAAAGSKATACWSVEGTGKIGHTALHYDGESHPSAARFDEYKGGAVYPDNGTQADPAGYPLPGTFCAAVPVPATGSVHFRAHAIDSKGQPGILSAEKSIQAEPGAPPPEPPGIASSISWTHLPPTAASGSKVLACWRVEGSGKVPHTAIHWDTTSHPSAGTFQDYKGGAAYPDNETQPSSAGYKLPAKFCTSLRMPPSGPLYARAHVIDSRGPPGTLTADEKMVAPAGFAATTSVTFSPEQANPGSNVIVCWRVDGAGNVPHTAIHWDTTSHPAASSFQEYKGGAAYPDNATSAAAEGYKMPGRFCTLIPMPAGNLYFRSHVIDSRGAPGLLSQEKVVFASVAERPTFTSAPITAMEQSLVCWEVGGKGKAPHVAVHWDTASHPTSSNFQDYKAGAAYPDNATAPDPAGYALPGNFCTNVPMGTANAVFYRAHVIDSKGAPGLLSDERTTAKGL